MLTRQSWGRGVAVSWLLASTTSMTPGLMPSTPSLAALVHSGTHLANPGQLSDCFPGAWPCASIPFGSITKPNHWHCLPTLYQPWNQSLVRAQTPAGMPGLWWAPLQTSGVDTRRVIASVIVTDLETVKWDIWDFFFLCFSFKLVYQSVCVILSLSHVHTHSHTPQPLSNPCPSRLE